MTQASETEARDKWSLRLYVAGDNRHSQQALRNLQQLCEQHIGANQYTIEVIDLLKRPDLAKADQIIAIPTLVRKLPEPVKRIIGSLSDSERALLALDIPQLDGPSV